MIINKSPKNLNQFKESYEKDFKYANENALILEHYASHIVNYITSVNPKNALSLGIGHGVVSRILSKKLQYTHANYTLLEGSKDIINEFNFNNIDSPEINIIHTYFENFTSTEKFDLIEMGFILEHVDDPLEILVKYRNLLSENGSIFIGVPNAKSLHRLIGFEAGLVDDLYHLTEYDLSLGHQRYFDLDLLLELLKNANLTACQTKGLFLKPITTSQIRKLEWQDDIIDALLKIGDENPGISNAIMIEARLKANS